MNEDLHVAFFMWHILGVFHAASCNPSIYTASKQGAPAQPLHALCAALLPGSAPLELSTPSMHVMASWTGWQAREAPAMPSNL